MRLSNFTRLTWLLRQCLYFLCFNIFALIRFVTRIWFYIVFRDHSWPRRVQCLGILLADIAGVENLSLNSVGKREFDWCVLDRRLELLFFVCCNIAELSIVWSITTRLTDQDDFRSIYNLLFFWRIDAIRGTTLVSDSLHERVWALKDFDGTIRFKLNAMIKNFLITL